MTGAEGGRDAGWAAPVDAAERIAGDTGPVLEASAPVTLADVETAAFQDEPVTPAQAETAPLVDHSTLVDRSRWISQSDQSTLAASFALSARRIAPPRRFAGLSPIVSAALLTIVLALAIASCVGAVRLEQMGRNLLSQPAPHATTTPHASPTKTVAPKKP